MEINIQEIFKEYSNLYQFEEGSPEYLIDKEDFNQAIKEIVEAVLLEASNSATLNHLYFREDDDYEKYEEYKNEGFLRTDGDGIPYAVDVIELNKKSITSTINKVKF